ncbi:MAG: hypothetical protein KDN22_25605 [Verrucomicrobiae bacterium]|nr:hypothetical protein [Verrucomicrobiae bacterium]
MSSGLRYFHSLAIAGLFASSAANATEIDFSREIRPLLSDKCYSCHGPDAKSLKGELRLDLWEVATSAAKSGAVAIVPGNTAESELVSE